MKVRKRTGSEVKSGKVLSIKGNMCVLKGGEGAVTGGREMRVR